MPDAEIRYHEPARHGAFGRNGTMHQHGLHLVVIDDEVWLRVITSKDHVSGSARISIPRDQIDEVIKALEKLK